MPAAGGTATWLDKGRFPSWSPDGKEVLYVHEGDVWRIPASGGEATWVLQTPESEYWPQLSPDGERLLCGRMSSGTSDIWIADLSELPGFE